MVPSRIATQDECLQQPEAFEGRIVELHGRLAVGNYSASLTLRSDSREVVVGIVEANIAGKLIHAIPCYVGGRYLYNDEADVIGRIRVTNAGEITLDQIHLVRIQTADETYEYRGEPL